jgi:hypothetical protein
MTDPETGVGWLTLSAWEKQGYSLIEGQKCEKHGPLGVALYSDSQVESDDLEEMLT